MYDSCVVYYEAHTYDQFSQLTVGFRIMFSFSVLV